MQLELPVVEIFHSIQGEGFWSGSNAFFVRLAGCNVGCSWCDQKESWSPKYPMYKVDQILSMALMLKPRFVVITGGEPLQHNLDLLTQELLRANLNSHLETSGVYEISGIFDWVTFSPKPHKLPQHYFFKMANELKVVVSSEEDLQFAERMSDLTHSHAYRFLQPCWGEERSISLVKDYILLNPKWRISLQTHKILGVR